MNISQRVLALMKTRKIAHSLDVQAALDITPVQAGTALRDHTLAGRLKRNEDKSYIFINDKMKPVNKNFAKAQPPEKPATQMSEAFKTKPELIAMGKRIHAEVTARDRIDKVHAKAKVERENLQPNLNAIVDEVGKNLAGQIISVLEASLKKWLSEQLTTMVATITPAALTPSVKIEQPQCAGAPPRPPEPRITRPSLPRIAVTGLLPQQAGIIATEFQDTFDIDFWNDRHGDSTDKLKNLGLRAEAVFVHVEHSAHTTDKILQSVDANLIRVKGGISSMRDALTKYFCERKVA